MGITFVFYTAKKSEAVEMGCNNVLGAKHVCRECENKNMKIFSVYKKVLHLYGMRGLKNRF